jgi:methyl-accepting chemotaxis protein
MKKANKLLTIFYGILLIVAISVFSALLSTTHTININDHVLNISIILSAVLIADLIFFFVNPLILQKTKDLLDENYNTSSEKDIDILIKYPFKIIPLTVMTELAGMLVYLILGNVTHVIEIDGLLSALGGLVFTYLFVLIISIFSQIYVFKIVTNTSISKAIRKLNIVELKSFYVPIKYKLIGVYTIISLGAFMIIAYAVINNANRYIKESLYSNTMKSAARIADTINNNPNADSILKNMAEEFKGKYRFYLYNMHDKDIKNYSTATLTGTIIKRLGKENMVSDTQNGQTLFSLHQSVSIDRNTYLLVVGVVNSMYKAILYGFFSTMSLAGIFILFIVIITTFLISSNIASHEKSIADYSAALSGKKLSRTPALVSTDELGLIALNLRTLMKNFKESKIRTNDNVSAMNNLIGSTFKNISQVKSTITAQSKYTDDLFGIINSIKDLSLQITDLSAPFSERIGKNSETISHALRTNKEIKSYINASSTRITRTLKLIEKDINEYEDIKHSVTKLKHILVSIDSTSASINTDTSADTLLQEFTDSITNITTLNDRGIEFTKDIEVMLNETQNIAEGVLSFLSTFLSHIQQADEMLGIINNVAERTNLLSVNAFILASSPQTEGKNFRVVAEEIKRLAARARTGSKDISDYITKVRRNVDDTFTGIKEISGLLTTLAQSMNTINTVNERTGALSRSVIDITATTAKNNKGIKTTVQSTDMPSANPTVINSVNKLIDDISAAVDSMKGIGNIFNEIKDMLIHLTEINNAHDTTLTSIGNDLENIKTFTGSINDSLAIDIKEQVAFSSDSAKELIDHIKNNEQNISDLDTIINQLIQELDLLKENINLFIV